MNLAADDLGGRFIGVDRLGNQVGMAVNFGQGKIPFSRRSKVLVAGKDIREKLGWRDNEVKGIDVALDIGPIIIAQTPFRVTVFV